MKHVDTVVFRMPLDVIFVGYLHWQGQDVLLCYFRVTPESYIRQLDTSLSLYTFATVSEGEH